MCVYLLSWKRRGGEQIEEIEILFKNTLNNDTKYLHTEIARLNKNKDHKKRLFSSKIMKRGI